QLQRARSGLRRPRDAGRDRRPPDLQPEHLHADDRARAPRAAERRQGGLHDLGRARQHRELRQKAGLHGVRGPVEGQMSTPYDGAPLLTDEQRAVVDLPADEMTLVVAGAGAGKTHTLVRRLDALVEREGLGAGEILVLSFSRAAVREWKERRGRHGDAARRVGPRAFGSWAVQVGRGVGASGGWRARDFDGRIAAAAQLLGDTAVNVLYEDLRHVVIDEVQDLGGARRELV